jgi:hypothetical protein
VRECLGKVANIQRISKSIKRTLIWVSKKEALNSHNRATIGIVRRTLALD